jgi:hypothetical protein
MPGIFEFCAAILLALAAVVVEKQGSRRTLLLLGLVLSLVLGGVAEYLTRRTPYSESPPWLAFAAASVPALVIFAVAGAFPDRFPAWAKVAALVVAGLLAFGVVAFGGFFLAAA